MADKDKKGAMFALKRKKLYEGELEKIQNVKMTLETQVMNLESATQNADTFMAMKQGTNAMKNIRQNVGIDKVDDMMDEIKEEMDMATEISNAIAQPVDPYMHDEDELLKELEMLGQDDVEAELLKPTPAEANLNMPAVPAGKLPTLANTTADEEAELRRLEAEIAGMQCLNNQLLLARFDGFDMDYLTKYFKCDALWDDVLEGDDILGNYSGLCGDHGCQDN